MYAHLFFNTGANHIVSLTDTTVVINEIFRDKKERNAPATFRRPLNPGQGRMNNIVCQVMLSAGNEYLISHNGIRSVRVFYRGRGKCA